MKVPTRPKCYRQLADGGVVDWDAYDWKAHYRGRIVEAKKKAIGLEDVWKTMPYVAEHFGENYSAHLNELMSIRTWAEENCPEIVDEANNAFLFVKKLQDNLDRSKRRKTIIKVTLVLIIVMLVIGGIGYWKFAGSSADPKCQSACGGNECGRNPACPKLICGKCSSGHRCLAGHCEETSLEEMLLIPPGSFWMGCNKKVDKDCYEYSEMPYHEVTLGGYYIDRTEVTVSAYGKCVSSGNCAEPAKGSEDGCNWGNGERNTHPMNCVTWKQASDYCEWMGKRLPTEAEWEKAARGTDGRKFPWGNHKATCKYAVMSNNGDWGCGKGSTWEVCSKSPFGDSPYGLCDMAGNVNEWVSDWYDEDYYANSPTTDPTGPVSGSSRVHRGDGWGSEGERIRTSFRDESDPFLISDSYGFRCVTPQQDDDATTAP